MLLELGDFQLLLCIYTIGIHIHVPTRGSIKRLVFCDESSDFLTGIFNIEILLILSMKIKTEVESALALLLRERKRGWQGGERNCCHDFLYMF